MKHAREDYNGRIIDLLSKIPEEEPVFLLRGQDVLAPNTVKFWAKRLKDLGGDPKMIDAALRQAEAMLDWQEDHNFKTPDMPDGAEAVADKVPPAEIWECTFCGAHFKKEPVMADDHYTYPESDLMHDHQVKHDDASEIFNFVVYRESAIASS